MTPFLLPILGEGDSHVSKKVLILSFVILNLLLSGTILSAWAQGVISLPWTGQTKCYNESGAEISCAGTGQDGELQTGVDWPEPRFTVSGDCVTDNLTGLMWSKNGNLPNGTRTWQGALDYVASINSGSGLYGYKDWRLPNVNELESLVNAGEANCVIWLNSQGFVNVQSYRYWSSNHVPENTIGAALNVDMWGGTVGAELYGSAGNVWPVRSGQASPCTLLDFDGDGKTDIAVWRPGNGYWYIIRSSDGNITYTQWGALNDVPVSQ